MASLAQHLAYLQGEYEAARAAPLSPRKALLVALLIDAYADRLFAAQAEPDDILEFRADLAAISPALALVFALAAQRPDTRLVTESVEIPLADYGSLPVEDFMVSLYNAHSVQRVRLALPDGGRRDVHEVLGEAIAALRTKVA